MSDTPPRTIDRTNWPPGPWDGEPDRLEWRHAGLPCLMVRNHHGAWCGYAAVPPGHPCFERDIWSADLDVHGSLTYAGHCSGDICHVPPPGEPDRVWWLGFDCAHAWDLTPRWLAMGIDEFLAPHAAYRDLAYVQGEVNRLAEQLAAATS